MFSRSKRLFTFVFLLAILAAVIAHGPRSAQAVNDRRYTVRFIELFNGDGMGTVEASALEERINEAAEGGHLVSLEYGQLTGGGDHRGLREVGDGVPGSVWKCLQKSELPADQLCPRNTLEGGAGGRSGTGASGPARCWQDGPRIGGTSPHIGTRSLRMKVVSSLGARQYGDRERPTARASLWSDSPAARQKSVSYRKECPDEIDR